MSAPTLRDVANVLGDEMVRAEIIRDNVGKFWGEYDRHRLACLERAHKVVEFVRIHEKAVAALAKKKGAEV